MLASRTFSFGAVLLVGLSLSIGWGIRGNFGHEYGAMIPGALAAMGAALVSGREDWRRRTHLFGFFGALGWSFGGSISYMQVIAYTHSGHSLSVIYGFASLFLIGFLWAAVGGAGTALPAVLKREELTAFFPPLTAIFIAWELQDLAEALLVHVNPDYRHTSPLYWYDTDWLAALTAPIAVTVLAVIRRRWDQASSLVIYMAIGWWAGFLVLVNLLGLRMTPPRGDNWAGCLGMVIGLAVFLRRQGWWEALWAALLSGLIGGFGFATATMFKLMEVSTGLDTNWHSVLEQTYGLINGLGIAAVMLVLARRAPLLRDTNAARHWTDIYAVLFILGGITYLNLSKNPEDWIKAKTFAAAPYGLSADTWFLFAYLLLGVAMLGLLLRHRCQPLALLPSTALGKGQLLYLIFLWWMAVGNFERAVVNFTPQRLITEGVIHLNAVICTCLILSIGVTSPGLSLMPVRWNALLRKTAVIGSIAATLSTVVNWGVVRAIYGDRFAGYASKHIRFGPDATATKDKPKAGQPHP